MTNLEIIELFLIHFYGWEVRDEYLREVNNDSFSKKIKYLERLDIICNVDLTFSFGGSFVFEDTEKGHYYWYEKLKMFQNFIEFTNLKNIQNEISYKDFFKFLIMYKRIKENIDENLIRIENL